MLRSIGRSVGNFYFGGPAFGDPTQAFRQTAPVGLLDEFEPEQQAELGRNLQRELRTFVPSRAGIKQNFREMLENSVAMRRADEERAQRQDILSRFGVSPTGAAPAAATGQASGLQPAIMSAAERHGVDPNALMTIARLESGGDPSAQNPNSSAGGPFQFIDSTARAYGLEDRFDPNQSADAAARLMRDNAASLSRGLGREPTTPELYLAHQQGATGALRLLRNPDARAVDVVGRDAVRLNGGREDMTAGEFANQWMSRASAAQPQAAQEGMDLPGYDRQASADRYFQAARDFAAMGDIETAEQYFDLGERLFGTLPEPPSGQIAFGAEIHPGLDPNMAYFVDENGRPTPLGQRAGENASTVSTIVNGFNTATREMGQRLIASETAVEALKSDNDFAVTTGLLNWLTAIGARPRVGADGQYTSESGIAPEFFRVINQLQAGGQLTDTQRGALTEQINLSRQPILDRLTGFEDATAGQLRELGVSEAVINSVLRSARGTAQGTAQGSGDAAPAAAPTPDPGGLPRVTSDADYNRLPSGAEFIDPDGNRRRKP